MFDHKKMRDARLKLQAHNKPAPVEIDLRKVIDAFAQLYEDRCTADYNIGRIWSRTDVTNTIAIADEAFRTWRIIHKEKAAQHHLISMFGARQS
jgi:hypothetical protein